jgi:hypothetical protein
VLPGKLDDPLGHVTFPFCREPRGIVPGGIVPDRSRNLRQLTIFILFGRHIQLVDH